MFERSTLRMALQELQDPDVALFALAVALGLVLPGEESFRRNKALFNSDCWQFRMLNAIMTTLEENLMVQKGGESFDQYVWDDTWGFERPKEPETPCP